MKLTKEIKNRILEDNDFSLDLAKRLNIRQDWVLRAAKRDSNRLLLPDSIAFLKEAGYTESEIFTPAKRK